MVTLFAFSISAYFILCAFPKYNFFIHSFHMCALLVLSIDQLYFNTSSVSFFPFLHDFFVPSFTWYRLRLFLFSFHFFFFTFIGYSFSFTKKPFKPSHQCDAMNTNVSLLALHFSFSLVSIQLWW